MSQAHRWLPSCELVVVGDSAFAALEFLAAIGRHRVTCVTRLRLDAALYDPAAPRLPDTTGRPHTNGRRLATLSEILTDPTPLWKRVTVPGWYDSGERDIEVSTDTAVWRYGGRPIVPIRWAKQPKVPRAQRVQSIHPVSAAYSESVGKVLSRSY